MYSERINRLTGSLIREILALTQQPGVISFAAGLPATTAMPPLDLSGAPQTLRQYGTTEGEPELRAGHRFNTPSRSTSNAGRRARNSAVASNRSGVLTL